MMQHIFLSQRIVVFISDIKKKAIVMFFLILKKEIKPYEVFF